ncbi:hypothetical protein JTE90_006535 [Oedothorax gibbosus]|uniref:Uncharacterized protein n=1 Tax=Oedothorax gibbosus TaxID=931172 RepID=A0AAV6TJC4_9ARAC|nr:hypothetical protein JTE90_006535 [Oedothorax gibbosus]
MIGRADIEGHLLHKTRKVKRIDRPAFAVRIHTENQDQASFCPLPYARFLSSLSSPWDICVTFDRCTPPAKQPT